MIKLDLLIQEMRKLTQHSGHKDIVNKLIKGEFEKRKIDQLVDREYGAKFIKMVEGKNVKKGVSLFYDLSDYEITYEERHSSGDPQRDVDYSQNLDDYILEIIIHESHGKNQARIKIYQNYRDVRAQRVLMDSDDCQTLKILKKALQNAMEWVEEDYWEGYFERKHNPGRF